MSRHSGDMARANRIRKQNLVRRVKARALKLKLEAAAAAAAEPKK